ncbi:MAG: phosphotransferase [Dehalococcoidia bacterium]|nr:phosphotransferase [Dehalococcoidia bacterium]
MATNIIPRTPEEITPEYLNTAARRLLGDERARVSSLRLGQSEPFAYPKFGNKSFDVIEFDYECSRGSGSSRMILRRRAPRDAVSTLIGDTQHRELLAFKTGLLDQLPATFHHPYLDVIHDAAHGQYWAFLEDVSADMARLGIVEALPDETIRLILSHLAAFHARFWQRDDVLSQPWLMSLRTPVDSWYRLIVETIDNVPEPAEATRYMHAQWPWLADGITNLLGSLEPETRRLIEGLFREPDRLLRAIDGMPLTLCHYDFDNRNLGFRHGPDGPQTVVIDWEIVGVGLASADVGRFLTYQNPPNVPELLEHYLDELERGLGHGIDRAEWYKGFEIVAVAIWQIVGFLFGAMVASPEAPVPEDQREGMRQRVYADVASVERMARKWLS